MTRLCTGILNGLAEEQTGTLKSLTESCDEAIMAQWAGDEAKRCSSNHLKAAFGSSEWATRMQKQEEFLQKYLVNALSHYFQQSDHSDPSSLLLVGHSQKESHGQFHGPVPHEPFAFATTTCSALFQLLVSTVCRADEA